VAAGGNFFAVQQKADARGIVSFYHDFMGGANGSVGGRDQGFCGDGLAIGSDGDPGILCGANEQRKFIG
jgi:hypothetical protein